MLRQIIICSFFLAITLAQFYEDKRCRCVCPTPTSILNSTDKSDRVLYIAYVPPNKWYRYLKRTNKRQRLISKISVNNKILEQANYSNCYGVVLPKVADEIRENAQVFCPRCDCKYETRNTTVIMVVVILLLWIMMMLIGYYLFIHLLEFLITKKQPNYPRTERNFDEIESLLAQSEDADY